eukprot:TRINITY_DN21068_c0_g1_i1.p1 TRINITY_DN21068_c0_g1~~TRINITY_DN21068_c0_g1_i1.p1  ORF type:complete len:781 (+),score=173.42 TRINITY_DN21068_c0_g1_i1:35-2377(+)
MEPFICTADKKARLQGIWKAYYQQLKTGCGDAACNNIYCRCCEGFVYKEEADDKLFGHAKEMVKDAFRDPPIFRFCQGFCYPTKAAGMEIMKKEEAEKGDEEYYRRTMAPDAIAWMMLDVGLQRRCVDRYEDGIEKSLWGHSAALGMDLPATRKILKKIPEHCWNALANDLSSPDLHKSWLSVMDGEIDDPSTASKNLLNGCLKWRLARLFTLLFECQTIRESHILLPPVCVALASIHHHISAPLCSVWGNYSPESLTPIVDSLQTFITLSLMMYEDLEEDTLTKQIPAACTVLSILFEANFTHTDQGIISNTKFYNERVNEVIDAKVDFDRWRGNGEGVEEHTMEVTTMRGLYKKASLMYREANKGISSEFTFSVFPFLLDASFKHQLLNHHARHQQHSEMRRSLFSCVLQTPHSGPVQLGEALYLILNIDRHDLLRTTLRELNRNKDKMRRPLRVQFANEEGIDEGGVKKEFFQMVVRQLVDPSYGMFIENTETNVHWFQPTIVCNTNDIEFMLIGKIVGLAIYNYVILDINFPKATFKKLLNIEPVFTDLKDLDKELYAGLKALLDFEEADGVTVEDTFCRTFTVTHDVFGTKVEVELKPNGADIPLTIENRSEYVELYADYIMNKSVGKNFEEFKSGFYEVCGMQKELLATFHPDELERMVVGCPVLDLSELEELTRYDGYVPTSPLIVYFWSIIKEMSLDEQRSFLKFTTGTDRLPIRGLKSLNFVIGKNGGDSDQLPTAHTCFNHLLLPEYPTREKLKQKLMNALANCQGFGLM